MAFPYDPDFTNSQVIFRTPKVLIQVFYGDSVSLGRVVVYKVFKLTHEYLYMRDRFNDEVNIAQRHPSPNICEVFGYKEVVAGSDTYACIVMERLERDWQQEIDLRRRDMAYYEEQELWSHLITLVGTLAALQEHNLAHRDLKPDNIFMLNGRLKLGDFGSSRDHITSFVNMTILGTPCYLSPLLAAAHQKGLQRTDHNVFKSDVYSLGVTFIQVLLLCSHAELSNSLSSSTYMSLPQYSNNLKHVLQAMVEENEALRPDFLLLCRYLGVAPSLTDIVLSDKPFCAECCEDAGDCPYYPLPCGHFYAFCSSTCAAVRLRRMRREPVFLCPLCESQYAVDDQAVGVLQDLQRTVTEDCEFCRRRADLLRVCCIVLCKRCASKITHCCPNCEQLYTPTTLQEAESLRKV